MRLKEIIEAELKLSEAHAQVAQLSGVIASFQYRDAQLNAQRLAAELRERDDAEGRENSSTEDQE